MAWEKRGAGTYLYSARREGGKVVKTYVGCGPLAQATHELEASGRLLIQEAQRHRRTLLDQIRRQDTQLETWLAESLALAQALIRQQGYHRPGRGKWRKQRMAARAKKTETPTTDPGQELVPLTPQQIARRTVDAAFEKGAGAEAFHAAALVLREEPKSYAGLSGIKAVLSGGLPYVVRRLYPGQEGEELVQYQILLAAGQQEAAELAGLNPSPAVLLLAHRVIATKYHLAWVERRYDQERAVAAKTQAVTSAFRFSAKVGPVDHDLHNKRLERAQRMHLAAVKALVDAQRLPLPTVQIATTAGVAVQVNAGPTG